MNAVYARFMVLAFKIEQNILWVRALNPLNAELNPICHLLALFGVHFLHVSRIRIKSLTLRILMSYIHIYIYIYMEHPFLMFLDHTQWRTTVGRTPLYEWSVRCRDLYLTTHDTHNRQISMPPVGFEPTISVGQLSYIYKYDISSLRVKDPLKAGLYVDRSIVPFNSLSFSFWGFGKLIQVLQPGMILDQTSISRAFFITSLSESQYGSPP
jgi:hypothetical protein